MSEINKISKMSFSELLKIEFMKCKRSKIVPLIFIAPLLVVSSGIANLSSYFTPEYTNAWPAMFIQSALVYAYYLLPFSMIVVCVMIASRETGNNGILKMLALPVSRYALSAVKFCVLIFYLFMEMVVFLAVFVIGGLIATKTMGVTETLPILFHLFSAELRDRQRKHQTKDKNRARQKWKQRKCSIRSFCCKIV
jgi:lantibiotic transport system permease protein